MRKYLDLIKQNSKLVESEAYKLQQEILSGNFGDNDLLELFTELEDIELSEEMMIGFVKASREHMVKLDTEIETLDIVGTGGDGLNTFNISTAAALVCASMGIPVAKHGNRSASSKCGSFDVLEAVGVNIEMSPQKAAEVLDKTNCTFLFARKYHPDFKHVGPARKKYGKRTYFNFLGPLLNPAKAEYMVLGVSDITKLEMMGKTAINLGSKKVMIVRGKKSGIDEISAIDSTIVKAFKNGEPDLIEYEMKPEDFGLIEVEIKDLEIDSIDDAKNILTNVLKGKGTQAQNTAVILNAAAGIVTYKGGLMKDAVKDVQRHLLSGRAYEKLEEVVKLSNS